MVRFFGVLIFVVYFAALVIASCPPQNEDTSPCECLDEEDYIEVECKGNHIDKDDVKKMLGTLDKSDDVLLVLEKVNLGALPANFFEGFKIIKIEMEKCQIASLAVDGGKPFSGLEDTLTELEIVSTFNEENNIISLDLSHLKKLTDLEITDNVLRQLDDDWFREGPKSLMRVVLSNNGFEQIGSTVFQNLDRLDTLTVEGNRFSTQIDRNMFPNPANMLEELELNNNALTYIPENLFSNMPKLNKVALKGNGILRVEESTFSPIWPQLETIDMRENPLECGEYIEWMKRMEEKPGNILGQCQTPPEMRDRELANL